MHDPPLALQSKGQLVLFSVDVLQKPSPQKDGLINPEDELLEELLEDELDEVDVIGKQQHVGCDVEGTFGDKHAPRNPPKCPSLVQMLGQFNEQLPACEFT